MKVHQLLVRVIDFDQLGAEGVAEAIENADYPNRCISPRVARVDTRDCGEWHDEHPLNQRDTAEAEWQRLFSD